jgi:pimeloyl-ACP methyl ester carboxylesterase
MDDVGGCTTRFASNGAVRLAYDDLGPAAGEPLLMILGVGASRFWWPHGLLVYLQEHGFRPAVVDLRDCGESTHLAKGSTAGPHWAMLRRRQAAYSAEDLVDDAAAVLDALDWPAAHVFGVSFGGVVAQRLALRQPRRVLTVSCFASGPSDASTRTVLLRYMRWGTQLRLLRLARRARNDPAVGLEILQATAAPGNPVEESVARDAIAREQARGISSFRDLAAQGRQTGARWHGPPLRELRKPVLVMCGDADPVLRPRASRDTAAAIPNARLVILPGVGHIPPRPTWPTIAREMRALAETSGPQTPATPGP